MSIQTSSTSNLIWCFWCIWCLYNVHLFIYFCNDLCFCYYELVHLYLSRLIWNVQCNAILSFLVWIVSGGKGWSYCLVHIYIFSSWFNIVFLFFLLAYSCICNHLLGFRLKQYHLCTLNTMIVLKIHIVLYIKNHVDCAKYNNHFKLNNRHNDGRDHLMNMRMLTLKMNKIFIWAMKTMRKVTTASMWIC